MALCTPARPRPSVLGLALLVTTASAGCDSLPFIGDDDDAKAERNDDTDRQAEIEAAKKAAVEAYKKEHEAEVEARIAAEVQKALDAHKAEAEQLAAQAEDKNKDKPVVLSNLRIQSGSGYGRTDGTVEVRSDVEIKEPLGGSTFVHVKALCKDDGNLVADVSYLNSTDYNKQLDKYAVGEKAEVRGSVLSQGLDHKVAPCQLAFRLGGMGGGVSVDLGQACWDGKQTAMGPCEEPIVAVAASGAGRPVDVLAIEHKPTSGYGARGLNFNYQLLFNAPHEDRARLTLKAACEESGKTYVDVAQAYVNSGPFKLEPGEAIARAANLFWSGSYSFPAAPSKCDLTASRWTTKPGSYSDYDEDVLHRACFSGGAVTKGRCSGPAPSAAAPVAMSDSNATLDNVEILLTGAYGAAGKFQLELRTDLTVTETLASDQAVNAEVTCKVGRDKRIETVNLYGTEAQYLLPGETAKVTAHVFGSPPMDQPKSCQVAFKGGARYMRPGSAAPVDLGTYCLRKGTVKKSKC